MTQQFTSKGLIIIVLLLWGTAEAQNPIPNPGFENWNGGEPVSWFTSNVPGITPVTQSGNAHSGSSALRGEVLDIGGGIPYVPAVTSGNFPNLGFPVSQRYTQLSGYYQLTPVGPAFLLIQVLMFKNGAGIGVGIVQLSTPANSYTQFATNIAYGSQEIPDSALINITVFDSSGMYNIGSNFLLDDLQFGNVTGISDQDGQHLPQQFILNQNYPNPFNPSTTFSFTLAQRSDIQLTVYNQLGQVVATVARGAHSAGEHQIHWDAANLPGGVYYYRLQIGNEYQAKKMILLK